MSVIQELLCYHDIYDGAIPDIKTEIKSLNMHKSISIISELIAIRQNTIEDVVFGIKIIEPFETVLKAILLNVPVSSPESLRNPLFKPNRHIISLQMLLILLKKVIVYGNYETMTQTEYTIDNNDYINIIRLQLLVAEEFNTKFNDEDVDLGHFIYGNYHVNYDRNVASGFARSYYMLEKLSRDVNNFDSQIQNEYRDYYGDFVRTYNYTPMQYMSLLFWELSVYYQNKNIIAHKNLWRNVQQIYGNTAMIEVGKKVIANLSQKPESYMNWAKTTEKEMWDFSLFCAFPFINDAHGNYISISEYTLKNSFFEKIFWKIRECYPDNDSRAMSFYGRIFEKYIQDLTKKTVEGVKPLEYIPEFEYGRDNKKSSDAYIRLGNNLLIIEAKGYSILLNSLARNIDIEKNNEKLFVNPILQADERFDEIDHIGGNFDGVTDVYIVSVTMDSINAVPHYLNTIHNMILTEKKSSKTRFFYNMCIEEYEMLMYFVENRYSFFDILSGYFDSKYIMPFSEYLKRCTNGEVHMTKFLEEEYKQACDLMRSMYAFEEQTDQ